MKTHDIIIRLNEEGFFGKMPWGPSEQKDATKFPTMKAARRQLNRLRDRLGYPKSEIILMKK